VAQLDFGPQPVIF
jgi:hypothetical protein